jgi:glycosyltransferase involved in cell wall biosynthesis
MHNNLVSVITPTYNRADKIQYCLNSVYYQTYRPIELIIIDDGSSDNTAEVIDSWASYKKSDGFMIKYIQQENRGPSAARNHGIRESTGNYIQYLDSDDFLHCDKINNQVINIERYHKGSAVAVYGDMKYLHVYPKYCTLFNSRYPNISGCEECLREWLKGWTLFPHMLLWTREAIELAGGWDEHLFGDEDGEYSMRYLIRGGEFRYYPCSTSFYVDYRNHFAKKVGATDSPDKFESRKHVLEKIEREIEDKLNISDYAYEIMSRYVLYAKLAKGEFNDYFDYFYDKATQYKEHYGLNHAEERMSSKQKIQKRMSNTYMYIWLRNSFWANYLHNKITGRKTLCWPREYKKFIGLE